MSSLNRYWRIIIALLLVEHQQAVELFVAQGLGVAFLSDSAALVVFSLAALLVAYVTARWKVRAV